ncbi:hypothetical protein D031_2232B, partial [Vibrio parahaemolyticus VP-48]
FISKSCL